MVQCFRAVAYGSWAGGGGGFWVGRVGLGRWSGIDRESRRSARGGGCMVPFALYLLVFGYRGKFASPITLLL